MDNATLLAQHVDYWISGILTVSAAAIVTIVILLTSRSGSDAG